MSDLVTFLLAQLDADEAAARALVMPAHDGYKPHPELSEWFVGANGEVEYVQTPEMLAHKYADPLYVTCDGEGLLPSVDGPTAAHIARHDPARVLAEAVAKRAIVALHGDGGESQGYDDDGYGDMDHACKTCGTLGEYGEEWPCATLRALASVYEGAPGWQEEWR